jgi:hypothetical protein
MNEKDLRIERLSLCLGTVIGQISELLNYMKQKDSSIVNAYRSLRDIHNAAGLQIHELYYKDNIPNEKLNSRESEDK